MLCAWLNTLSMIDGDWLVRDSNGEVVFHSRDAFVSSPSRLEANFQIIEWSLQSFVDLQVKEIEVWCDFSTAIDALTHRGNWLKF